MHLPSPNVTAAHARNHSEYLHRAGLTVAIPGDPLYWWSMSVADDGRAALMVDAADLPTTDEDGVVTHHSLTATEVASLVETLPEGWNEEQGI
jgi:hypothetical protein